MHQPIGMRPYILRNSSERQFTFHTINADRYSQSTNLQYLHIHFQMEKCDLTSAEISRYSRQLILPQFGVSGTIGLVDDDKVELNNLHRQIAHSESTINMSKVHSLADRCMRLNSTVNIQIHEIHLDNTNALDIIKKYDVIMDCSDNLATRYLVNEACAVTGPKPLVSGSALRLEGQMTVYLTKRILSTGEMLSPNKLPPESRAPCFRCIYPVPPPKGSVHGCSEAGVFGVVPGIIGTMQAAEVIKLLTGIGGQLLRRKFLNFPYIIFLSMMRNHDVPLSELFRDSVISEIRQIMDTKISKGAVLPFPVILLCYRGNKSAEVAPLLKCALSSLRCSNSDNNFDLDVTHSLQVESKCFNAEPDSSEFIICDVAGGLLAWSLEVDPNFPIY
ncbi:Adenylyltransferase and sulfurtransferase MOCS3 isoform 4 [Schistosoma japonicum]|uniref:Adenylyltransferase and sulfurtransferase MOCS3 isoform 4 n=1 Tax=Schistosoma japonicum TaxID=6182 RepID=A0A4Z2DK30_SCHJA|nr:Adenylyltransferase and sulfurtransferase MOCS3 isoform 4 [Schistosoma japonicum]